MEIDPSGWLKNFDVEDQDVALAILDSFIFFNEAMTTSLLKAAMSTISTGKEFDGHPNIWNTFINRVLITFPTGESPSPTDSGHLFVRQARQKLGFSESQIHTPNSVVDFIEHSGTATALILMDDIVGSGDQLIATWNRDYPLVAGGFTSLSEQYKQGKIDAVYVVAPIITVTATERLSEDFSFMQIRAAHILGHEYCAINPNTNIVPEFLRERLHQVISKYSPQVGCPSNGSYGHGKLGLNLAFSHSMPDLTLPLIWANTPNWTPLRRRS